MNGTNSSVEVKNISKFFHGTAGSKLHVLDEINFKLNFNEGEGSFVSVLAPFGAGKSTLLKIIGVIEKPDDGNILVNNSAYDNPSGKIVYIPEQPSSFPWFSVKQNLLFASSLTGKENPDLDKIIDIVGLTGYEEHYPHEKSIGFRFRISLARALALNPLLILLDDPFKKLHGETRSEIFSLIKKIKDELKINFLFSTTSITEAVNLSGKIFLMKKHPGQIFKEITIDQNLISSGDKKLLVSVRAEIESAFSEFEGTSLVSEVSNK